jgi:ParB-like chromosome segregation protein Spo0J
MKHKQTFTSVDPATLEAHPANPRRGDVDAIIKSIEANGFYGALIVQSSTRRVLAGNHRLEAALRLQLGQVPIIEVDCSDEDALTILLADNRVGEDGEWDADTLLALAADLDADLLDSVGFSDEYLQDVLEAQAKPFRVERVNLEILQPHPRNYQEHPDDQLDQIEQSIRLHGFYRNVIVAQDNTILAGHGVVEAARRMGRTRVPIIRLPLDPLEPRALKVLTSDNEINNLAVVDDRALTDLLREIMTDADDSLEGTGFTGEQLAALTYITRPESEVATRDAAAEWVGLPDYEPAPHYPQVNIKCETEKQRDEMLRLLEITTIGKKTGAVWSCWWPDNGEQDLKSIKFEPRRVD